MVNNLLNVLNYIDFMCAFCELKHIRTTVVGSEVFTVTEIKIMVVWIMTLFEFIGYLDFSHHMY
jgi:hypothetical protein